MIAEKLCAGCGETKAIDEFGERRNKPPHFRSTYCRPCVARDMRERRAAKRAVRPLSEREQFRRDGVKRCNDCREVRPLDAFGKRGESGRHHLCFPCRAVRLAAWREANRESERERHRIYTEANREQERARLRKYVRDNPEKVRAHVQRRRARLKGVETGFDLAVHFPLIHAAFGGRCAYCAAECDERWLDHVVPVARGGGDVPSNIVPCCADCNRKKGARPAPPWHEVHRDVVHPFAEALAA